MSTAYGNLGTTLVEYSGNPTKERDAGGLWSYTYRYWCEKSKAIEGDLIPDNGDTKTIDGDTYYLNGVSIEPHTAPQKVDVILKYGLHNPAPPTGANSNTVAVERRAQVVLLEKPVDDKAVSDVYSTEVSDAESNNQKTLPVAGIRYEYTETRKTFTWSEANLIASTGTSATQINKTGSPDGITSPTANHWILRGIEVNEGGGRIRVTQVWEWAAWEWPN